MLDADSNLRVDLDVLSILQPIIGGMIVAVTLYDVFATVVGAGRGAGPITDRIATRIWNLMLKIHRRGTYPKLLRRGGPGILVTIIIMWLVLLIFGWSMVFGGSEVIVQPDAEEPLGFIGKLSYAASTVIGRGSTVGRPAGDLWEALEVVAGVSGILLLSLSIAYVIPVIQAVVIKRKVALYISSLGDTPDKILNHAWNGTDLGDLHLHVVALTPMVADLAERHLAYPIVHYFHSDSRSTAIGPSIVALDETLTMNARVIDPGHRIPDSATIPLRQTITLFLDTLDTSFIEAVDGDVDDTTMQQLEEAGVPVVDELPEDPFSEAADRRRLLRGYLEHDGWHNIGLLPRAGEERETREEETEAAE